MSEKREKQWAVLKYHRSVHDGGPVYTKPLKITWYDSRKVAREQAKKLSSKTKKFVYEVAPMTRGPGA